MLSIVTSIHIKVSLTLAFTYMLMHPSVPFTSYAPSHLHSQTCACTPPFHAHHILHHPCIHIHAHKPYMLNTRKEEKNTVCYSCLACFVNTATLNMPISMSDTGSIRRNTLFVFLWLRHSNT